MGEKGVEVVLVGKLRVDCGVDSVEEAEVHAVFFSNPEGFVSRVPQGDVPPRLCVKICTQKSPDSRQLRRRPQRAAMT